MVWRVIGHNPMTVERAREIVIDGINYAAYRETDSSLYDSDKNRMFGSEHYQSSRFAVSPSPWEEGNFEKKMTTLLRWAVHLNGSNIEFVQAVSILKSDDSVLGRIIRRERRNRVVRRALSPLLRLVR